MGILAAILGNANPIAQWTDANHGWLSAVGKGIGSGFNLEAGLANAASLGPAGQLIDQQYQKDAQDKADRQAAINQSAKDLAKFPDLMQAVASQAVTPAEAYAEAWRRSAPGYGGSAPQPTTDIQNYEFGLTHPDFASQMTQKGGAAETALQPTWGIDNDKNSPTYGQKVLGQLNKAGKFVRTEMPSGVTALDPVDLQGQKTGAQVDAKTAGAARAALPAAQQAFTIANKAADALLNDPAGMADQFGNTLLFPNQWMPAARPGSDMARFRTNLEQAQGDAFLQARNVLKGAGQITDYEGAKAEAAYSRMALAAKNNNQQEFIAAVQDFKQAVAEGYAKLQAAAQGDYAAGGPGITGSSSGTGGFKVLSVSP